MNRLALGALALIAACTGCILVRQQPTPRPRYSERFRDFVDSVGMDSAAYAHPTPEQRERGIRVGFVSEDVELALTVAQRDTVERLFQVVEMHWRQLPRRQGGLPGDSMFIVTRIMECSLDSATDLHAYGGCPNRYAPTIHTHVRLTGQRLHSSDPSPPDWLGQYLRRSLFDGIVAGSGPIRWYYFRQNPYRGRGELPLPADSIGVVVMHRATK